MQQDKELQRRLAAFDTLCKEIESHTAADPQENPEAREKRLQRFLKNDWKGFEAFANHYFPHLIDAPFGWFHKAAFKAYAAGERYSGVWEWPRGHAKSIFLVMLALYDKARNRVAPNSFRGLVIASVTGDKAEDLLGSIQAELMSNQRFNTDFGQQYSHGDWTKGNFSTMDGYGFWAFGVGQNPAGVRKGARRPSHIFADDCDDKKRAENPNTVAKDVDWINGELKGCLDIKYGGKFVYVNNRVHKAGTTAHMVGDVEPGSPVNPDIHHLKVFITENPKTHARLDLDAGGVPAWSERFTVGMVKAQLKEAGWRNAERQYYHNHIEEGHVFREEWIVWNQSPALAKFDALVSYCDPSFKDTKANDFKAVVLVGLLGRTYHVLDVWLRQASPAAMAYSHLLIQNNCPAGARHYFEANFIQDMHRDTYDEIATANGWDNLVRPDRQQKDKKESRIEGLSILFEHGNIVFNEKLRKHPDMVRLIDQFLAFPYAAHDDGPDAVQGAISLLRPVRRGSISTRSGGYNRNPKR